MATTKKNNVNNSNVTKVICQNCGAEILIPNHQHAVAGVAIGKDSGLGTVVLPTKCGSGSPLQQLNALTGGNSDVLKTVMELVGKIEDSGYLDVNGIVRRWIPSQCLEMVFSREGFHAYLIGRGYDYSWKVLMDELKKQAKLYAEKDMEAYAERHRWYNGLVAKDMANGYIYQLRKYVEGLRTHSCKHRLYKKVKCQWMNYGKGIFVDQLSMFFEKLERISVTIATSRTAKTLYEAVIRFNNLRQQIKFTPADDAMSKSFINAYKAAGAYYTMKDLIMFEGCLMQIDNNGSTDEVSFWDMRQNHNKRKFVQTEESLIALENKASDIIKSGVNDCGYMMLGLLKDFLHYNNFNLETTKNKWREQSELRKALRISKRGERRSRK